MKVDGYPASEYPIAFRILSERGGYPFAHSPAYARLNDTDTCLMFVMQG